MTEVWVSYGKAGKKSCLNLTLRFVFSLSLVFVVLVQVQTYKRGSKVVLFQQTRVGKKKSDNPGSHLQIKYFLS